jgi:hypothetical protein
MRRTVVAEQGANASGLLPALCNYLIQIEWLAQGVIAEPHPCRNGSVPIRLDELGSSDDSKELAARARMFVSPGFSERGVAVLALVYLYRFLLIILDKPPDRFLHLGMATLGEQARRNVVAHSTNAPQTDRNREAMVAEPSWEENRSFRSTMSKVLGSTSSLISAAK